MDVLGIAAALAQAGEPFALATVVWCRGPTSGKPGSKAIIYPNGRVEGWLGGACAEPTVVQAALEALGDGRARLLVLGESDGRPGVVEVPMACDSEGAMEVYVEPMMPRPDLWVIGRSPAVDALVRLAAALHWRTTVVDDRARPEDHREADRVLTTLDLSAVGEASLIVVATQGHYDEAALEASLQTPAAYLGLVASAKRASAVFEWLRGRGVTEEGLTRVRSPAGLDLGATGTDEIAVAILAELVALRASGAASPAVPVRQPETAIDPICGMTVDIATSRHQLERDGVTWYFCSAGCRASFEAAGPAGA